MIPATREIIAMKKERMLYPTTGIKEFIDREGIGAMDLVRICNIAVSSAYKLTKGEPVPDLDVLYRVYMGFKEAGYQVTWLQLTGIV
jgi:predicted transcriptional regulator